MREFPPSTLPGVLIALVRQGRLLLVQRGKDPDRGKWGLPGGMIEAGETVIQAAHRELAEETALRAAGGRVIDQFELRSQGGRYHYNLTVVQVDWQGGEAMAGSDAAALGWFTLPEMAALPQSRQLARIAALVLGT